MPRHSKHPPKGTLVKFKSVYDNKYYLAKVISIPKGQHDVRILIVDPDYPHWDEWEGGRESGTRRYYNALIIHDDKNDLQTWLR